MATGVWEEETNLWPGMFTRPGAFEIDAEIVAVAVAENAMPRVDATPGAADEELTQAAEVLPTRRS